MNSKIKIWGKVIKGMQRGKTLGFPTANFPLHKNIDEGIYISNISFEGKVYPSVTFIGNAKTYSENDIKVETYILDFNSNIYGKWVSVKLIKKIRRNKKFKSEKKLINQIKKDIKKARLFFVGERGLEPPTSRSQTARSTN